jgi:hypothetical protein
MWLALPSPKNVELTVTVSKNRIEDERFVMNLMLASSGYSWKVVPVVSRNEYITDLEAARVDGDIKPFAKFLGELS